MRILDRYIVREILRHAFLGLIVFTFVFFVPQLVRLMALFVRHTGSGGQIAELFLCIFPGVFTFTFPMAVLIGVLLGLGRMSMDSEIVALTSLGIGRRRILVPVGIFALGAALLTLVVTLWLGPLSMQTFRRLETELLTSQINYEIQPRVFDERFPKLILYVNNVSASGTQWHGVFVAETGDANNSRLTLAENAIVIAEPKQDKLQLHLQGGTTHDYDRSDENHYSVTAFGQSDWPIDLSSLATAQAAPKVTERSLRSLREDHGPNWREARVELYRRLAFPFACFAFALIAVPVGAQPRRGGRAAGSLIAVVIIAGYYLVLVMGSGMARDGKLPPFLGIWLANILLLIVGLILLPRMEQFRGENRWLASLERTWNWIRVMRRRRVRQAASRQASEVQEKSSERVGGSIPRLMDLYVLRRFLSYFSLLMVAFIFLYEIFTFFELLDDIARHHVAFFTVMNYFRYLTPFLIYQLSPLAALVAILVTLGVMSKNNEIVACKASGLSLYRLVVPLLFMGVVLAGLLLVLDNTYLPYANQRQDALRNQIKGRPAQTYKQPQRWIFGENSKIYNYDFFDPTQSLFGGLTVLELDSTTFQMRRRIFASRARWSTSQNVWVLEGGWIRDFSDGTVSRFEPFKVEQVAEMTEQPKYFNHEVLPADQMSWPQLGRYIANLQRAGFEVANLTVQWHKKLAFPLIAPISMLLAFPFAIFVGTRGAIGGIAVGVAIGITYWMGSELLSAMGSAGQLPPFLAGWSPDIVFFFLGLYFLFKMPT